MQCNTQYDEATTHRIISYSYCQCACVFVLFCASSRAAWVISVSCRSAIKHSTSTALRTDAATTHSKEPHNAHSLPLPYLPFPGCSEVSSLHKCNYVFRRLRNVPRVAQQLHPFRDVHVLRPGRSWPAVPEVLVVEEVHDTHADSEYLIK